MKSRTFILLILCLFVVGCASKKERVVTLNDLCITSIESNQKICYDDERAKVEKITGPGKDTITSLIQYEDGLGIIYRYDRVVLINLIKETKGKYKAVFNIGDSRQKVIDKYGEENLFDTNTMNANFFYDSKEQFYYDFFTYRYHSEERDRQVYVLSTRLDKDELVDVITLSDSYAITNLR